MLAGSVLLACVGGILSPAIAALTVVLTRKERLTRRFGRNAAFERGGNVAIALAIGVVGFLLPDEAVFLLVPALCVVAAAALFSMRPSGGRHVPESDGAEPEVGDVEWPSAWSVLRSSRPLMVFALCSGLFHFANAPLLTLVAQDVSRGRPHWSSTVISVCIVGAQAVMVPMAIIVGRRADAWGRKPLLVAAFLALPLRAILYVA